LGYLTSEIELGIIYFWILSKRKSLGFFGSGACM